MREKPKTIDAYLAALGRAQRPPLERLRQTIRRAVPAAEECISYGMPAFRVEGGIVGGFAATKDGYSYYPFSGQTLDELAGELEGYSRTKSALHFSLSQPLPSSLVRRMLQARLSEIRRRRAPTKKARPPEALGAGALTERS
jgi:uncharacterized protein YdhG (YjbR/CyaY superfamily)